MKTQYVLSALLLSVSLAVVAPAAPLPGSLSTDYLAPANWLEKVTIGADGEVVGRTVEPDGLPDVSLDVAAFGAFLGYDLTPAVTAFITIGGTEDSTFDDLDDEDGGNGAKFSLGANVNLAAYDIRHPATVNGDRLTIRLQPEFASYDADTTQWTEWSVALPVTYEFIESDRFVDRPAPDRFVLAIYAGPLLSYLDGEFDSGSTDVDFEADKIFGVIGGVDFYFTRYLSLGGHVCLFDTDDDQVTGGGSARYHF